MSDLYVNVEAIGPTTQQNSVRNACNVVRVGVSYQKGNGVVASAMPAESKDGFMSLLITAGSYLSLAPAARLNRKQVQLWEDTAKNHVDLRTGCVWDLVLKVCSANGLRPKGMS